MNNFDLKRFRSEKLEISQSRLAEIIGVRQDTLSRYEENPENIPLNLLMTISQKFGISLDQIFEYEKSVPQALDVKNNWSSVKFIHSSLTDYIKENKNSISRPENLEKVNMLCQIIDKLTVKPKLVFLGRSDSGKSTMINALIGEDRMPTNWTPTTSVVVYIKHLDDRPDYMEEDLWVFKNDERGCGWDDSRLNDESYTKSLRIASGDASMLATYGTSQGEQFRNRKEEISSAVLFVDCPILKNCDILDVPGFAGGKPGDNKAAEGAAVKADALIYLSQSNSFMGTEDFIYLKGAIENLPVVEKKDANEFSKLSNLFVIATQAHIIGNEEKIAEILDDGSTRFYNTLTENFWQSKESASGYKYEQKDLAERFFSYSTDAEFLREKFEEQIKITVESLPVIVKQKAVEKIKNYSCEILDELEEKIKTDEALLSDKETVKALYDKICSEEARIKFELKEKRNDVIAFINKRNKVNKEDFAARFRKIVNETTIVEMIKEQEISNTKKSKSQFMAFLSSRLDEECKESIVSESEKMNKVIDEYTDSCQNILSAADFPKFEGKSFDKFFNVKRAFVSGLSGAATLGALAFWASTLGNLGGYIIVAKAVSVLAALGIHIGGTATVISVVSSLGGPLAWGIGAAVIVACTLFAVFGGGWKKQFAKGICKEFEKSKVIDEFNSFIDNYWKDTQKAFILGADQVERDYESHKNALGYELVNYNKENIEARVADTKSTKEIILNIPV